VTFIGFFLAFSSVWWFTLCFALAGVFIAWEDTMEDVARDYVDDAVAGTAYGLLGVVNGVGDFASSIVVGALWTAIGPKWGFAYAAIVNRSRNLQRASNPDAALYYLARMVGAGEDPKFIARRMVIFASEDIGMAQPTALVVANEVLRAVETIGYPECAINLAHGAVYLATARKDRAAYNGLRAAQADVRQHGNLPIPLNLRNAPTRLMKELGYGKGYQKYSREDLLPERLRGRRYYKPE